MELVFTPAGQLMISQSEKEQADSGAVSLGDPAAKELQRLVQAFRRSSCEGLFSLATRPLDASLPPAFRYWRDFTARYLSELCQIPTGTDADIPEIPPPPQSEVASLLLSAPPMPGAEYLSQDAFLGLWGQLDDWVRNKIQTLGKGLAEFLNERAPMWHQVGRVCFHLAENRRDPDFPFAFLATYSPSVSGSGRVQYVPLSEALEQYAGARNKQALIKLLSPVQLASESSPLVRELVDTGDLYHPIAWTSREAHCFLQSVPVCEQSGILVRLPDWWKKRPRPQVSVTIGSKNQQKFDMHAMLDFKVKLALGDQELTKAERRELLAGEDGLVLLRGQWVEVDQEKLKAALEHWKQVEREAADGLSFIKGMRLLAGASASLDKEPQQTLANREWSFVDAGSWLGKILGDLRRPDNLKQADPGSELQATLREYQKQGVNWLHLLSSLGLGACLADDMGLGKTIQVIALLLVQRKQKTGRPALLVLPASLLANWKSEIERFAPSLRTQFVHPSQISKDDLAELSSTCEHWQKRMDVVLTTYGMLQRQPWLLEIEWQMVVLDEAQAIKNPSARQTKLVKQLKACTRIALTGTPVENRISDLWSLFDFLCPGLLGSIQKFKTFAKGLEAREHDRYAPLRNLVSPYILRRLKTDKNVIADLPEKTELRAYCGLSKVQAAIYTKLVKELSAAIADADGIKRRGLVLAYLMRFKQLCNHPSQLLGDGQFDPKESGKFARLFEICDEIASRQEKVLVFTQFREMTDPLAGHLSGVFGKSGLTLQRGTRVNLRHKLIDQFQRDNGPPFFVLSLKAGGTGLNLTAASHVIHFDRWWNPAVENQATDRAFRIGQKRNVLVHKFVCQGTIEERIDSLIDDKSQLATDLLTGGVEKVLTEMSDTELIRLVSLDVDRVQL